MAYYGAHVSISKGIGSAIETIKMYGGNFFQVFISNPRSGRWTERSENDLKKIEQELKNNNMAMVIHSPYVLNFSKPFDEYSWWIQTLIHELKTADKIDGCIGSVLHFGKSLKIDKKESYENFVKSILYVIQRTTSKSKIIIETAAGQGTEICYRIEDFAKVWNMFPDSHKERLGICIDTCHIFAAGYNITTGEAVEDFFSLFNKLIGIKYISLVHLNDSKRVLGSRVDRHENIGDGMIGKKGLNYVVKFCKKYEIPIILETPNFINANLENQILLVKEWLT